MAHDPYAPKRNPAADILDQNVRKLPLPAFLRRQDGGDDNAQLAAIEAELADYIERADERTAVPVETVEQLDLVAGLKLILKRLTYSEMKSVAAGIMGTEPGGGATAVASPNDMADRLEAWATKEKAA